MKSKKILALVLSVIMLVSLLTPFSAFAAEVTSGTCGENLTWSYNASSGALTIKGTGAMYDFVSNGEGQAPWRHLQLKITSVDFGEGVTSIGDWAFAYCYYIRMVNMPETSLAKVGNNAFYYCSNLEEVLLPETVTILEAAAFAYCGKLLAVAIPSNLTVKEIGKFTFVDCKSLEIIYFAGDQSAWNNIKKDATDAAYFAQANIMLDTTAGTTWNYDTTTNTLTIGGYGRMKNYAAHTTPWKDYETKVKTIIVEEGVTGLGNYAFGYCYYATKIELPSTLIHIGANAFYNCSSVAEIKIPDGVRRIFGAAFYNCKKLDNVVIPNAVDTIYTYTFEGCTSLTNVSYNGTKVQWQKAKILDHNAPLLALDVECLVKSIEWTFDDATGTLTIGGGVAMDDYELKVEPMAPWTEVKAKVKKVVIEDGIPNIGKYAFYNCAILEEVVIPNSVTSINTGAFQNCYKLDNVILPENLTYLGGAAFRENQAMTNITIPNTLPAILSQAFYNTKKLNTIYYVGTEEQFNAMTITTNNNYVYAVIDAGNVIYLDKHPNAGGGTEPDPEPPVGDEFTDWTYADGVLTINANTPAFEAGATPWAEYAAEITTVVFAEGVNEFGAYTFENLAIESIVLPEGTTTVPANAFAGCVALSDITLPASLTNVDENAFIDTAALTTVYFDGTEEAFAAVTVADGNEAFTAAEVVYTGKPGGGIELPDFDF